PSTGLGSCIMHGPSWGGIPSASRRCARRPGSRRAARGSMSSSPTWPWRTRRSSWSTSWSTAKANDEILVLQPARGAHRAVSSLSPVGSAEDVREQAQRGDAEAHEPAVARVTARRLGVDDGARAIAAAEGDVREPALALARGEERRLADGDPLVEA